MEPIVSRTLSVHKEHELLLKLEAAGLNESLAQRIIDSKGNDLAARIVKLVTNGGIEPSLSQKRARKIMGTNFFGIQEATKHFGVIPTRQQLAALSVIPFTAATLSECKNTHILAAVFPMSIIDIRSVASGKVFYAQDWYDRQSFATDRGEVGWHLVRKAPIAHSTSKTWSEQQALLGVTEETPRARIVVYTMVGHFLVSGERLFEKVYVRCSDLDSRGNRVVVGLFNAGGLNVVNCSDDLRNDRIGLSSVRKFD